MVAVIGMFVDNLERLVSKPRLDRYRPADDDPLETAVSYLWNLALSEALLQGIAWVEIALRNSIHNAFTDHAAAAQWFWAILKPSDLKIINEKWSRLAGRLKAHPPPTRSSPT